MTNLRCSWTSSRSHAFRFLKALSRREEDGSGKFIGLNLPWSCTGWAHDTDGSQSPLHSDSLAGHLACAWMLIAMWQSDMLLETCPVSTARGRRDARQVA